MMFTLKSLKFCTSPAKKQQGIHCCAYGCKNLPNARKRGLCHKHYHIHRRIIDPVYDRFFNFRGNAKKRCKVFTITLAEFRDFCNRTGYIIKKGMRGRNCTIDRLDNRYGYHIWNIGIKSNEANIRKYHDVDKHLTELPTNHEDYCPF